MEILLVSMFALIIALIVMLFVAIDERANGLERTITSVKDDLDILDKHYHEFLRCKISQCETCNTEEDN